MSRPRPSRIPSYALIVLAWAILQIGGLFTPGLLDDVDSVYIQIAREMLQRHDFVTPTIDGIRFFDKPPLMYWMAAGSMRLFGIHDWAARLPLALGVLALLFATYALGNRLYPPPPGTSSDRAGLYAALALATCLGPYLYTRFYIPDILIALWMTLAVHLFLIALERVEARVNNQPPQNLRLNQNQPTQNLRLSENQPTQNLMLSENQVPRGFSLGSHSSEEETMGALAPIPSPLLPMLAFGAVLALSVLTKGLIGIVFPILFVLLYLAFTRNLRALLKLHIPSAAGVFLLIAAPWHILAALRNPPIAMPAGMGLPSHAGWAWFYLYNEHIARFLGQRIPHDYGQVPIPLFWLLLALWLFPWVAFLPSALIDAIRQLRTPSLSSLRFDSDPDFAPDSLLHAQPDRSREAALTLLLWPAIILGFFTLSSRQEYYHLPALPALTLLVGGLLAAADLPSLHKLDARKHALRSSLYFLIPIGTLLFLLCAYFAITAPTPRPGVRLDDLLTSNPALYNLSLGHVFDLTGTAMGFFRGPLTGVALGMLTLGPIAYFVRRGIGKSPRPHRLTANLLIAGAMTAILLCAHTGLVRFYPILGSKDLALQIESVRKPSDLVLIDGELTAGSTLLFYTSTPAPNTLLVNGRVNGPWFGSFWPDSPHIFLFNSDLHSLWAGPQRVFLLTYHPETRIPDLTPFGHVYTFAAAGGKTILTNRLR
jgi:4-amino-4-deoxy-L-arabinose transferase-like glycosyltransferase